MAQTPTLRTPVLKILRVATFHDEALATHSDPEHARLRARNETATAQLAACRDEYEASVLALSRPRARVAIADRAADREIDLLDLAARHADGGKPGALHGRLFPRGKTVIVQPVGATEIAALGELIRALDAGGGPLRDEWLARITAVRDRYESALADRERARTLCAVRRAALTEARRVWIDCYKQNQGALRELHASDKRAYESFFDDIDPPTGGGGEKDEGGEPEGA
ncbi:hypothetical protein [Sandaracinus amylolyticus]|uniref:hypothetical protein n=1 Tax=Sandaracinus amylolyticus TaxID=927083 RepID=UPI001F2790D2|nr:hypothetical protein [Sandaracinus amylolyticus]UJR81111.1 Hypothetical protein I5071_31630 [Sandaracinus amylolyticus]